MNLKGDVKLDHPELRGNKLPFPIASQFDVSANRATEQLQIRSGSFNLGATSFTATGQVDGGKKPANLNVHLRTSNSSLMELAKLSGALGIAFNPAYQIKGTVSADITATGAATAPQLNGSFSARDLDVSGGEIKQPVKVAAINIALSPDVIRAQPFTAQSGSTSLNLAGSLYTMLHRTGQWTQRSAPRTQTSQNS